MFESLKLFAKAIAAFWLFAIGVIADLLFFVGLNRPDLPVGPLSAVAVVFLLVGSFRAFHKTRLALTPPVLDLEISLGSMNLERWNPMNFEVDAPPNSWLLTLHRLHEPERAITTSP